MTHNRLRRPVEGSCTINVWFGVLEVLRFRGLEDWFGE